MNTTLLKSLFAAGVAVCSMMAFAQDAVPVTVKAAPDSGYDFDAAEKVFTQNDPTIVFKLTPLTPEQLTAVAALPDENRLGAFNSKSSDDEYHYTLDSAAEQFLKEENKTNAVAGDSGKKEEKAGEASFFVMASPKGVSFMFQNTTAQPGKYEVILEPLECGRFGNQGIHFMMDQNGTYLNFLGWQYIPGCTFNGVIRPEMKLSMSGAAMTRVQLPWNVFFPNMGDVPLKRERASRWKISVFRWAKDGSSSLCGIPYGADSAYFVMNPISVKQEADAKRNVIEKTIEQFYYVDQKKGNATRVYFGYIMEQRKNIVFWKERFNVIFRLGFPRSFSEYYLATLPRKIAKETIGDAEKTADENYRITEWQEDMELRGNFLKTQADNSAMNESLFRLEYERFAYPALGYEELRLEAVRDRFFTDKFLNEE